MTDPVSGEILPRAATDRDLAHAFRTPYIWVRVISVRRLAQIDSKTNIIYGNNNRRTEKNHRDRA